MPSVLADKCLCQVVLMNQMILHALVFGFEQSKILFGSRRHFFFKLACKLLLQEMELKFIYF